MAPVVFMPRIGGVEIAKSHGPGLPRQIVAVGLAPIRAVYVDCIVPSLRCHLGRASTVLTCLRKMLMI